MAVEGKSIISYFSHLVCSVREYGSRSEELKVRQGSLRGYGIVGQKQGNAVCAN